MVLYRPELAGVPADAARREGVNLLPLGLTVTALANGPSGVEMTFTDGGKAHYGLVVGADGIRSTVRRHVFGERYQPRYVGGMSLRWMVHGDGLDLQQGFHFGPGGGLVVAHLKNGPTHISSGFTTEPIEYQDRAQGVARLRSIIPTASGTSSAPTAPIWTGSPAP
ncbi:hypothetical protein [Streptomyces sp. NPDC057623]|uniref:hypothetical protein n=1 Tax=Streptomyces sp. NPDC057623 TaxID=3346187 RepID=UPI00367B2B26